MMGDALLSGTNQLELKSIAELSGMDFIIKDYQRGYRWTRVEVERLLDDFAEFVKRSDKKEGEFYCLQPIVLREIKDNQYEVIDGQQRLTTLNLLLRFYSGYIELLYPSFRLFEIEYVTRPDSRVFLSNIKHPTVDADEYIDFYFMNKAYQAITDWFDRKNDDTLKKEIVMALMDVKKQDDSGNRIDKAKNIRVIWYEVAEDEKTSSVDIFTRLNIGKIPLTDAELVKAVFLNNRNFRGTDSELRKINLSTEWNMMEQALNDSKFWHFLNRSNNPLNYSSRIEFVFDIMSGRTARCRKYHTFDFFQNLINGEGAEKTWLKVKQTYSLLNEWFCDREFYHMIGYLLEQGVRIDEIMREWESSSKTGFRQVYLRNKIKETIKDVNISELSYDDKSKVKRVLLLFNILTVLTRDNSDMRFPFDRFKLEKWDIEHVCSQTDRTLEKSGIVPWCDDMLDYYLGSWDLNSVDDAIANAGLDADLESDLYAVAALRKSDKPDKENAERLFRKFQTRFNETETSIPDKDNIANLTLLDYATNRSYGNAFFPVKRKRIIENDSTGVFVPIATKNLFMKYYSPKVSDMMNWTQPDGEAYVRVIIDTINSYTVGNS